MERCNNNRVIVVGDFNFPNINSDSLRARGLDKAEFAKCIQEVFLKQYVVILTRGGATLEIVLANEPGQKEDMVDSEISVEYANMLERFEIKEEMVLGLLKSPTVDMTPGPDGIYSMLLSKAREEIAGVLTKIFVSPQTTGEVPEDWQVANVFPLFKRGNWDNPGNYRPVMTKVIDEGRAVNVDYVDFSKAFDKIPHAPAVSLKHKLLDFKIKFRTFYFLKFLNIL
eukprot:g40025.t1